MATKDELLARIAAAQAAKKSVDDQASEAKELRELEEQARRAEKEAEDAPHIARAEEELGVKGLHFAVVQTDFGSIVLKRANPLRFKRFQDTGKTTVLELDKLVRPCLFYPDAKAFDSICEEQPYVLTRCADAVSFLAGVRRADLDPKS